MKNITLHITSRYIGSCFIAAWLTIFSFQINAQNFGTWTWMKGSNTANALPVYGTQGVAAPGNVPPAMYESTELVDLTGKFWIFGGLDNNFQEHAALWMYDPATNNWTWMKGPNVPQVSGVYGTLGVPAPGNYPGARAWGVMSWTDALGNLWIFGGYGYDAFGTMGGLNDLWKYDISTNQWTWMAGPNTANDPGTYGTQGVPAPTNCPPSRFEVATTWTANNGDLWLYGGGGFTGYYNDMWRYSPTTNMWTWMSGPNTTGNAPNYGTQFVPNANNTPGGRYTYARWKDLSGNFWLFGGMDYMGGNRADMWMYDINTNLWTWMNGSNIAGFQSTFTQKCAPGNGMPASRYENRCAWTDDCGRFWQFGGFGSGTSSWDDLWMYDPNTNQFTWVGGSTALSNAGNYGTIGVAAPTNYPESGAGGAAFRDQQGNFWMFGAWTMGGKSNALWKYVPDPNCPAPTTPQVAINYVPGSNCAPSVVNFNASTNNVGFTYSWNFGDPNTLGDTANTAAASYTYTTGGTFTVTLIISGSIGCATGSDTATAVITLASGAPIDIGNDTAICGAFSYVLDAGPANSWLWNTGATTQTITVSSPGTYYVTTNAQSGCPSIDTIHITSAAAPNIGPDSTFCQGGTYTLNAGLANSYLWSTGATTQNITVSTSGQYYVDVTIGNCNFSDTVDVVVIPNPAVNLGNDTSICGAINLTLDAGNPGATYNWSNSSSSQTINVTTAGTYYVSVANGSCTGTDTINITSVQPPSTGNDTTVCQGQNVTLTAGTTANSYLWSNGSTASSITVGSSGIYWVETTNGTCVQRDSITVTVNPIPAVDLGSDTTLCPGETIVLNAGNPGANFTWQDGSTQQTYTADTTGTYFVTVALNNCPNSDSILVSYASPVALGEETSLCGLQFITLDAGNPGATFLWNTGATSQTIDVATAGEYWVQVDNGNCVLTDTIDVIGAPGEGMLFIPNSFTPNGNGLNPMFTAVGEGIISYNMRIYDRWGMLVYQTNDINAGWDGTFKGNKCQIDTYVYVIEYTTQCSGTKAIKRIGHINLLR